MTKKRWLWVTLFAWVALLIATLAAGWNVVLVRDYYRMLELARSLAHPQPDHYAEAPWMTLTLGTLGFIAALSIIIIFFVRLLKEMHLNQKQSDFIATVSHELKTPIAAMELASSLIRAGGLSKEEENKLWESHQAELRRLRDEVEILLEAARWQEKPLKIRQSPVLLEDWLGSSLPRWRTILGPGSQIERKGDPLLYKVSIDLKTLSLITDNLLANSRKFARGAPRVRIETHHVPPKYPWRAPRWQIIFKDEGWGFHPSDSKKIFERFVRVPTGAPHATSGTGLGLFLARTACRAHGLTLTGHSPGPGKGAVFTLEGPEEAHP